MIRVTCAILVQEGKVLAAQRSESMNLPLKWEFPGGKLEEGESEANCIQRELEEELGVQVEVLRRGPDCPYPVAAPRIVLIPFVAKISSGTLEAREHAALKWCDAEELKALDWAEADVDVLAWWESVAGQF